MALVESFSHRLLLGPVASDLAVLKIQLLVFLIVFDRRVIRLVGLVAFAAAVASAWAHYAATELPSGIAPADISQRADSASWLRDDRHPAEYLRAARGCSDDVLGAVCGYVIAAGAWSNLFMVIEIFVPGSFSVGQGFGAELDSWHGRIAVMNYVSLGSLTGVGSGEVVPVRRPLPC